MRRGEELRVKKRHRLHDRLHSASPASQFRYRIYNNKFCQALYYYYSSIICILYFASSLKRSKHRRV